VRSRSQLPAPSFPLPASCFPASCCFTCRRVDIVNERSKVSCVHGPIASRELPDNMNGFFILLASIAAANPAALRPQIPVERSPGHLLIDAVAFDRGGAPVPDLRREELEVWIGGYRVPIDTFAAVTPGDAERGERSIVLLLDDVTLAPAVIPRARDAARRFVNRMSPGDQIAVVTLNGKSIESTGDRARLLQAVAAYNVRLGGVLRIDDLGEQVLETIASLARQLATGPERRKTIVAIGAAWLFDTPIPPPTVGRDLRRAWTDAMRAMASANVTLYVIDPAGIGMSRMVGGSSGFAHETGGYAFVNTNDVNGAADRIMREAGSYYLIGVADPPVGRKSDLRDLDVRVLRRGVTVRARKAVPGTR
jgi:VWFA-related protein